MSKIEEYLKMIAGPFKKPDKPNNVEFIRVEKPKRKRRVKSEKLFKPKK